MTTYRCHRCQGAVIGTDWLCQRCEIEAQQQDPARTHPDSLAVVALCLTEYTSNESARFTVRCVRDAGHSGMHRGTAVIEFSGVTLPITDNPHYGPEEMT